MNIEVYIDNAARNTTTNDIVVHLKGLAIYISTSVKLLTDKAD